MPAGAARQEVAADRVGLRDGGGEHLDDQLWRQPMAQLGQSEQIEQGGPVMSVERGGSQMGPDPTRCGSDLRAVIGEQHLRQ